MSDWNTTEPKDGSIPWKCTAAGNDIIMPGSENDHKKYSGWLQKWEAFRRRNSYLCQKGIETN